MTVPAFLIHMADEIPRWLPGFFAATGRVAPRAAGRLAARLLTRPGGRNPPQPWELESSPLAPRQVEFAGGLRALEWGSSGTVVLAQHGWRGRPTQFGRLAEALVPRGCRLVAIDAPGHGVSPGRMATPRLLADAIRLAADELGGAEALVGHSLGGAATAIALELGLAARRIAVLASPARPSRMMAAYADRLGLPRAARAEFDRWFEEHAGRPVAELDLVGIALAAGVKALVVHDVGDEVIAVDEARMLESAWPRARFVYTRGLGHRDLLADAAVVGEVAAFLAGEPGPVAGHQRAAGEKTAAEGGDDGVT